MPTTAETVSLIGELCDYIRANLDSPRTLAQLGQQVGLSPAHLQRVFTRVVGLSPRRFADACRLQLLKSKLKEGDTVTTAMTAAGYGSSSRLYERAAGQLGMTPGQYQKGAALVIRFTTAQCELGRVFLAATDKGICWLGFADTDAAGEAALRAEFPRAALERADGPLAPWVGELQKHLAGAQPHLDLPLDVRATAFQRRVWDALLAIPYGETRSYKQVAEAIGAPDACRAVARACATNPVAVIVPCHRVIGTNGTLTGYAGGLHRKKKLLEIEAKREQPQ
ncbi:Bifunctional transcriptional activator/DNA repair enzyme Ada [Gemmata obscuriglobus]|uniref:Methylated-DNA--protein-cysteine methyltransferase n=1 Tax=Gemmata obscuriglobus TaxID=114 RepID=A0A2Z3HGH0_9BACT|nr:methylated-DNA--[protein]-cysteine S-methyltransferase [Gemmata obscuriglobus]AWM42065.1 bifunctional transcriptional activator/DNA repair enzyme protein Ada [Gemmata obscuriglobus]QEG31940.1 Bifunctional transcriptional activator/DNA repair enzyme Ada [Gemmata obscuriglobus]VTS11290.1 family transcriptional regulator : Transcriptional regulator, AraC family OS=Burkholderia sp. H160 GN=BH160DRAFT_4736 PE=4 SV=1: HTH_18: Methyltransf_1N: DNA_binding_1 [Gemmata obscuriglobus UQM 2246]